MTSDEERREVADRLRGASFAKGDATICEIAHIVCGEDHCVPFEDDSWTGCDISSCGRVVADRLADLIEPEPERTCQAEDRYHDDDSSPWPYLVCSECGERLCYREVTDDDGEQDYEMMPFCAGCGAKVVE